MPWSRQDTALWAVSPPVGAHPSVVNPINTSVQHELHSLDCLGWKCMSPGLFVSTTAGLSVPVPVSVSVSLSVSVSVSVCL